MYATPLFILPDYLELIETIDKNAKATLVAAAHKELAYLKKFGRPLLPFQRERRESYEYKEQSPLDHAKNLERYLLIAPSPVNSSACILLDTPYHPLCCPLRLPSPLVRLSTRARMFPLPRPPSSATSTCSTRNSRRQGCVCARVRGHGSRTRPRCVASLAVCEL